jgi:hypothetical protein
MVSPVCQFLILLRPVASEVKNMMQIKMNAVMISPGFQFLARVSKYVTIISKLNDNKGEIKYRLRIYAKNQQLNILRRKIDKFKKYAQKRQKLGCTRRKIII